MYKKIIYDELQRLGVTKNYCGCKQLALAVGLAIEDESRLLHITKEIYWEVADLCGCDRSDVERNIRTMAHRAWKVNPSRLMRLAGYPLNASPSVSELITMLVIYVQRCDEVR